MLLRPSILPLVALGATLSYVHAGSTLLWGATIVAFSDERNSLEVIRNGSILITGDRIAAVSTSATPAQLPEDTERIDVSDQIITPGFVNTHCHNWQTAFRTIASNTTLVEYLGRYSEFAAGGIFTSEDVYLGQLVSLYEALDAGVTTLLDHAHHTWSDETAYAGLNASVDSGARVIWAYTFHNVPSINYTISDQIPNFVEMAESAILEGSPVELGISFDSWSSGSASEARQVADLVRKYNVSALTTHSLGGQWGFSNSPSDLRAFDMLDGTVPVVFSHASYIGPADVQLLRSSNQYISITPESEMHFGHGHPNSHLFQDRASLGTDTHFTFSSDILTQARLWLQTSRLRLFDDVLEDWAIPSLNPMSAAQAFLLATRAGGQALRRSDLGVIKPGAKADLVVWDAKHSPSMIGWVDPVPAVLLHASVRDVLHVLVEGKFVKRDGQILEPDYASVREKFAESARRIQKIWLDTPYPILEDIVQTGYPLEAPDIVKILPGETGYGKQFLT